MKFRIGIDFDNTIACYDSVFTLVAYDLGMITESVVLTKVEVKKLIYLGDPGGTNWQKLQGQIYGKFMFMASIFWAFLSS